ncbi:unnamed protein product [Pipistrellus nathusii]|uniref:Basic proline-rich protein-like n=1 Tax=Pipistrellus nathusii TaxID=59473 RepID=A0ABN9ZL27_PIPNA
MEGKKTNISAPRKRRPRLFRRRGRGERGIGVLDPPLLPSPGRPSPGWCPARPAAERSLRAGPPPTGGLGLRAAAPGKGARPLPGRFLLHCGADPPNLPGRHLVSPRVNTGRQAAAATPYGVPSSIPRAARAPSPEQPPRAPRLSPSPAHPAARDPDPREGPGGGAPGSGPAPPSAPSAQAPPAAAAVQ